MEPVSTFKTPSTDPTALAEREKACAMETALAKESLKNTQEEIERALASSKSLRKQVTEFSEKQNIVTKTLIVSAVFGGACFILTYCK